MLTIDRRGNPANERKVRRLAVGVLAMLIFMAEAMTMSVQSAAIAPEIANNGQWAQAAFGGAPTTAVSARRLTVVHEDGVGETKIGLSAVGGPLRLGEKVYARGIGTNSYSILRVELDKPAERFLADIGLDRNVDRALAWAKPGENRPVASAAFHVQVDGKDVFVSKVFRPDGEVQSIDVPLNGARTFDLILDVGGDDRSYDQGDWCDARVMLEDGEEVWLDTLNPSGADTSSLPFSFVYGGRSSRDFLSAWPMTVAEKPLDDQATERTLTFTDPETKLEVRAVAKIYQDVPGVDWTLYFKNNGGEDSPVLEDVRPLDVSIPNNAELAHASATTGDAAGPETLEAATDIMGETALKGMNPVLHRLTGTIGFRKYRMEEFQPITNILTPGTFADFGPEGFFSAFSSGDDKAFPFFNLQYKGGGVITAIGWTGCWMARVEQATPGSLRLRAGMRHQHLSLHPGEEIRTPRILQMYWQGSDLDRSYNLFRQTMLRRVMPKVDGKNVFPPLAHMTSSSFEINATTEAIERSYIDSFKDLGFECYWLDAWWMKDGFPSGVGNWGFPIDRAVDPVRFPNGIRPLSEYAHQNGLKFLMWFSPEGATPGTLLTKEHPEWLLLAGAPSEKGHAADAVERGGIIDMGNPEAREFMTRYLNTAIKDYGIDYFRTDGGPNWANLSDNDGGPDRVGSTEIHYVEGIYKMWDDLLAANPSLIIDNCCGGGSRIDLETCSRMTPFWRTDSTVSSLINRDFDGTAIISQAISASLNRYLPFSDNGAAGSSPYYLRSCFNGGLSFDDDTRQADYPREQLAQGVAECKRLRKYMLGNYYPQAALAPDPAIWCVSQYHRPAEGDGMVMAFRRDKSPYAAFQLALHEIDPMADYQIETYRTYELESTKTIKGADLAKMTVAIDEAPGSLLIEYRKK